MVHRIDKRRDTKDIGEENEFLVNVRAHLSCRGEELDRIPVNESEVSSSCSCAQTT